MIFSVALPGGVVCGEPLTVTTPNGDELVVVVPKGLCAGDIMEVSDGADEALGEDELQVVVPEGVFEGEMFTVETSAGRCFDLIVPDGCGPGSTVVCSVPTDSESSSSATDGEGEYKFRPGQLVQVLRTDGSYSEGTVLSGYEGVFDALYEVRLANGLTKHAVAEHEMYDALDCDDPNFGRHLTDAFAAMMEAEAVDALLEVDGCADASLAYMQAFWCQE